MALNKRYGDLTTGGSIKYAPRKFIENGQLFVPREDNDQAYIERGWYKIINIKPSYDPTSQIVYIKDWSKDEEAKTVTANYEIQARPADTRKKAKRYSKLRITLFCIEQQIWDDVKHFLEKAGYYDLFVMAQYFLDTDDYFQRGMQLFKAAYADEQHPLEELNDLIEGMLNFAFDGYEIINENAEEEIDETTTASNAGL